MDVAVLGILSVYQRSMWYQFVLQNGIIGKWWAQGLLGGLLAATDMVGRLSGFWSLLSQPWGEGFKSSMVSLPHYRFESSRLINHELDLLKPWANSSFLFKVGYFRHLLIITEGWQTQLKNSLFSPHPENRVCFLYGLNGNLRVKKKNQSKTLSRRWY